MADRRRWLGIAWTVLATGAGLGFVARDLLGLPPPLIAAAWTAGALLSLATARHER